MSAIKLNSSGGGSITISPASTASTLTLTAPAQTGTIGIQGPAFAASTTAALTVSNNTYTKLQCNTKTFDTNNNYDNTTNYRFTPTVAGYYMFYGYAYGTGSTNTSIVEVVVYKNGSILTGGSIVYNAGSPYNSAQSNTMIMAYMNGSTDYVELYGRVVGSGTLTIGASSTGVNTQFGGYLARGV